MRGGTKKINATPIGGGQAIQSGYRYYRQGADPETLVQAGNKVYKLNHSDGTWSQLLQLKKSTPLKWSTSWGVCLFSNYRLHSYDGSSAQPVTALNAPRILRHCENLDVIWGISTDNPTHVYRSPQYSVTEAWDDTDYSPLRQEKGDYAKDLCAMRGDWVLVLKGNSAFRIEGSTEYDLDKSVESSSTGLLGLTLQNYESSAIWLSPGGLRYYNAANSDPFLNISENKVNQQMFIHNYTVLDQAKGCWWTKGKKYLLSIPPQGTNTVWVVHFDIYNEDRLLTFPFTRWIMPFRVNAMWTAEGVEDNGALFFGDDAGNVYEADYGHQDDGQPIAFELETALSSLAALRGSYYKETLPDVVKNPRHIYLAGLCNGPLTVQLKGDYKSEKTKSFITNTYADPNALVWGTGQWGVDNWGAAYAPLLRQRVLKFNAKLVAVNISGSVSDRCEFGPPSLGFVPKDKRRFK